MWSWPDLFGRGPDRQQIEREADTLLTFLGDMAYDEARSRARACRARGAPAGARLWSKVAVTIARRTGYEVGLKAADRYEAPRSKPPIASELARNIQAIHRALGSIAKGQHAETELHNMRVFVLRALDLAPASPMAREAGDEVCRAAAALVGTEGSVQAAIGQGVYPEQLQAAVDTVERFRKAVLTSPGARKRR